jgi:KDO2-lipid IV(A) lauroyltransferase
LLKILSNYSGVALLKLLSILPYKVLIAAGYGIGFVVARIPSDRNRVVKTNLRLCFPECSAPEIDQLAKQHWRLLGRSLVEKSIIWLGTATQLSDMIEVHSEINLTDRKPRILVNMHFVGIEGSIILSAMAQKNAWPRTSGFFQRMKNPFFNQKIIFYLVLNSIMYVECLATYFTTCIWYKLYDANINKYKESLLVLKRTINV